MKGSCLCGAVEYEIDHISMPISHCHCRSCRKSHAAAFASVCGVMRQDFRWLKGEDKLAAFESSPGKLRQFCSQCGCHLVAHRENQPQLIVRVASLDDDPNMLPVAHILTSHDVPWLQYEGLPNHPEWPPGR